MSYFFNYNREPKKSKTQKNAIGKEK